MKYIIIALLLSSTILVAQNSDPSPANFNYPGTTTAVPIDASQPAFKIDDKLMIGWMWGGEQKITQSVLAAKQVGW